MSELKYLKTERLWLKNNSNYNETWVQDRIAEDPSILGLGDLILRDRERAQKHAGRLDLLLQDSKSDRRYELEVQLGRVDESHIIRAIEYWDIEKKTYPQYDHCAVIVAEDITSRFLNVLNLFNGHIPLIAIQMSVLNIGEYITLNFTTVIDELNLGMEEDDGIKEVTDRNYWEKRGTKLTVKMCDELLEFVKTFAPDINLKYNKVYIGLAVNGQPNNFISFKPQKLKLRLEIKSQQSSEFDSKLEETGLDTTGYNKKWDRYYIDVNKDDIKKHEEFLTTTFKTAYDYRNK
jgi:hypothetical protein